MSYILDALKKSELERAQANADDFKVRSGEIINQVAEPTLNQPADSILDDSNVWVIKGVYLILLLLLAVVLFKVFETTGYKEAEPEVINESKIIVPNVINPVLNDDDDESARQAVRTDIKMGVLTDTSSIKPKEGIRAPIAIEQAPQDIIDSLPILDISSHIFSTQAARRSIVVNGQRLIEGEYVAAEIQVKEITPQGMVIEINGWSLIVGRSRGWGL